MPFPFLSSISIKLIQLKMIHELAIEYKIKINDNIIKTLLLLLLAGITGSAIIDLIDYFIPKKSLLAFVSSRILIAIGSGAVTYAVGIFMINHFESGKNFDDIDIKTSRQSISSLYEEGKLEARKTGEKSGLF